MLSITIPSYLTQGEHLALERKMMIKRGYLNGQIYSGLGSIGLVFMLLIWGSCTVLQVVIFSLLTSCVKNGAL